MVERADNGLADICGKYNLSMAYPLHRDMT
jgi:hypothetical protein